MHRRMPARVHIGTPKRKHTPDKRIPCGHLVETGLDQAFSSHLPAPAHTVYNESRSPAHFAIPVHPACDFFW